MYEAWLNEVVNELPDMMEVSLKSILENNSELK